MSASGHEQTFSDPIAMSAFEDLLNSR